MKIENTIKIQEENDDDLLILSSCFMNMSRQDKDEEENVKRVEYMERITGYKFRDPSILLEAFTHHSYEEGCEWFGRLEFIGDSFLNLMIGQQLYLSYPDFDSGKLTQLRSVNVDTEKLARAGCRHNLHKYLRHNIPILDIQVEKFRDDIKGYSVHSSGLIVAPKVLADITESLIGAIYSDSKSCMHTTTKATENLLGPIITEESMPIHPVKQLHEICDKKKWRLKWRDSWEQTGEFEFVVEDKFFGRAKYIDKKTVAKNRAAAAVYKQILEELD